MLVSGFFYGWSGNYSTWQKAEKYSSGYNRNEILEKVKLSMLKVKTGSAVYERDSFIFNEIQYSFPLLSSLMWIAARNYGKLNVLDFGGSLGSTYYQNKLFLDSLQEVNWCIVEQEEFVKTGIEHFSNVRLKFYFSIEECLEKEKIDVILFSSVLQYLEDPFKLLENAKSKGIKYIIVDRTPFVIGTDRITVQKVNPEIYKASYPCRFFNKQKFIFSFSPDYKLIVDFEALDKANIVSEFRGFLFELI